MIFQLLILVLLTYCLKKWLNDRKYSDFDGPSPFLSLPFVGHGYLLGNEQNKKMMEFQKKYGDVFRFDIGSYPTVVLCSYKLTRDAFTKEVFSGRFWNVVPTFRDVWPKGKDGMTKRCFFHCYRLLITTFI